MEREFKLETILTAITGINLVDNFEDFWDLVWFVFDDKYINTIGLKAVRDTLRKHLLNIHPQLVYLQLDLLSKTNIANWLERQKQQYGETLPVCQIDQTLDINHSQIKSR